ncbi:hypothetical protein SAMN04488038_10482 [Solimonas aquatica]|uniref:Lipoprotein n=1 Tax=Solimonas aquatica TaxID=489703 RepID=A0A1H9DL45_9GAMM|nr:hypothetical protein [Solimonas aquatica]SEQ14222.1 hypothetical protein SAMN04488038_10482 [Solimonas aquatica]
MNTILKRTLIASGCLWLGAGLSACGGGGGGGAQTPAAVASKADVLRSLAVVLNAASDFDPQSEGLYPLGDGSAAGSIATPGDTSATSVDCEISGKQSEDASTANRIYSLFSNIVIESDTYHDLYTDCVASYLRSDSSSGELSINGALESGAGNYDPVKEENTDDYRYVLFGKSGDASKRLVAVYREQDEDNNVTATQSYTLEGLIENGSFEDRVESRLRNLAVLESDGSRAGQLSLVLGGDAALRLVRKNDGSLSISGPLSFSSSRNAECKGAALELATVSDLKSDGGTLVAGTLNISVDTTTASLSFQADGSAQLSVGGAAALSISKDELQAALNSASGC